MNLFITSGMKITQHPVYINTFLRALAPVFYTLFLLCCSAFADNVNLKTQVNRDKLYLGESLILSVRVEGRDDPAPPDVSAIEDCEIKLLGSHSESRYTAVFRNGKLTRQGYSGRLFAFEVTPRREGAVRIGPVFLDVDNERISHKGAVVKVQGIEDQDQVIIELETSRDEAIIDEPFTITLRVQIKALPPPYNGQPPLLPGNPPRLDAPYLNAPHADGLEADDPVDLLSPLQAGTREPGFLLNNYTRPPDLFSFPSLFDPRERGGQQPVKFAFDLQRKTINGHNYFQYSFPIKYRPVKEGLYTFGPVIFKGAVIVGFDSQRQPVTRDIFAVGPAAAVRVVPPPEEGRPESYYGAIGSSMELSAELDSQQCRVGDPLQLKLRISGDIRFENLTRPVLALQENLTRLFRVYDETARTSRNSDSIEYEYTVRPLQAGTYELPAIEAAYFDVESRRYQMVETRPLPLRVDPAPEIDASMIINVEPQTASPRQNETYQRVAPLIIGSNLRLAEPLPGTKWWLLFAAGPLLPALAWLLPHIVKLRAGLHEKLRSSSALREASRDLNKEQNRHSQNMEQHCWKALMLYLAKQLNLDTRHLTPPELPRILPDTIPLELRKKTASIAQQLFDATYLGAGNASAQERPSIIVQQTIELIKELDKAFAVTKKRSRVNVFLPLTAVLLCTMLPVSAYNGDNTEIRFFREAAETMARRAHTPEEYAAAAKAYRELIQRGEYDGLAFYNLGTLALLAGDYHSAAEALRRAERYLGTKWFIAQNMGLTWEQTRQSQDTQQIRPWYRYLFFGHFLAGLSVRIRGFILFFFAACVCLAAGIHAKNHATAAKTLAGIFFLMTLLSGTSILVTLLQEHNANRNEMTAIYPGNTDNREMQKTESF